MTTVENGINKSTPGVQPMSTSVVTKQAYVSFDIAYDQLMQRWEDPHLTGKITTDAGGKTRYGLSESAYPSLDISTITAQRAKEITEADYWSSKIWNIPKLNATYQPLANKLFQFGFNAGIGTVVQIANFCIYIAELGDEIPKLGDHLDLTSRSPETLSDLRLMLAAAQLSRYIKDYHLLSRVPHSLLDRALCIE